MLAPIIDAIGKVGQALLEAPGLLYWSDVSICDFCHNRLLLERIDILIDILIVYRRAAAAWLGAKHHIHQLIGEAFTYQRPRTTHAKPASCLVGA